ncbi:hypothetical protein SEPCBS57363_002931 [Sporothrix epigloea]|uniref:Uncharacterized protein n=1 Tax=Sporothrix epigloea TaxID=1892477 RepID=A0ABP0DIM4_9PEZI
MSTTDRETAALDDAASDRVSLPGFGLSLSAGWDRNKSKFPRAFDGHGRGKLSRGLTQREQRMLEFMDDFTSDRDWTHNLYNKKLMQKWRFSTRWDERVMDRDDYLSDEMFDYCIKELKEKAVRLEDVGFITILNAEVTVVKSDFAVSEALGASLKECVARLEDGPAWQKHRKLSSDKQIFDLLDPSLFPVVFGVTRALPYGTVPLDDCGAYVGCGTPTTAEPIEQRTSSSTRHNGLSRFQWLPADVSIFKAEDGRNTTAKIVSYINNLHPHHNRALYGVLEKLVAVAVPMWEEVLTDWGDCRRIKITSTDDEKDFYLPKHCRYRRPRPHGGGYFGDGKGDDTITDEMAKRYKRTWEQHYEDWVEKHRRLRFPGPGAFKPFADRLAATKRVDLQTDGHNPKFPKGLQIIFKLTNIYLTPEKSTYKDADWQVDGSLSEGICATALYVYDQHNIRPGLLKFRQCVDEKKVEALATRGTYDSLMCFLGLYDTCPAVQDLGALGLIRNCLVVFPNVLQHKYEQVRLRDPTKPGYCKILTMHLIDPNRRVLSSANVPPQRKDWWSEYVHDTTGLSRLPFELFTHIVDFVDTFPLSLEQALRIRADLELERKSLAKQQEDQIDEHVFTFSMFGAYFMAARRWRQ